MVQVILDTNVPEVVARVTALGAALPAAIEGALPATAAKIQDALVPVLQGVTPVGETGHLRDQTQAGAITEQEGELSATIISDAANGTSGYLYARARAFGHVIANQYGTYGYWTPPEDPVYPQQAVLDGGEVIDEAMGAMAGAVDLTIVATLH